MPSRSSAPAKPAMLFLAPPSDPAAEADDSGSYPESPPVQRRPSTSSGRPDGNHEAARDGGARRRSPGRTSGGRQAGASGPAGEPGETDSGTVRMTRGARRSAIEFGITDADVSEVLSSPSRVAPEQDNPDRTRFSGGGLTVVTGADGTILHVSRRRA